ncbi:hypothetical protein MMC30_000313 [Trapelia coarctata]|nr:hypothetical protein [Trapelia coarctata]
MAAGTNWKRPWEEDADGSSDHSASVVPPSGRSSVSSHHPASSEQQHGATGASKAQLPPLFRDNESFTSINANQRTSPGARDSNQADGQPLYQASLTAPHKRQRTSVHALDLPSSPTVVYQLKGSLDGHDGEYRFHGTSSTHELGSLRNYSQDTSARNSHEFANHLPATTMPRSDLQGKCKTCGSLRGLVPQAASIVEEFYEHMFIAMKDRTPDRRENMESLKNRRPFPGTDLYQSWVWVLDRLSASVQIAKELLVSRHVLLQGSQSSVMYYDKTRGNQSPEGLARARWEKDDKIDNRPYRSSPHPDRDGPRRTDRIASSEPERRKSIAGDVVPHHMQSSPFTASPWTTSRISQPDSPMQAPPSIRQLPSPSSLNFPSASQLPPPLSPSFPGPKSPHTAHLQDLQHQLSTKSLAHQILQTEHEKLLAAYSRSQMRCATLEKKSHVSDTEINNLAEDRARLTNEVDRLELQVEELQQKKDEADKQSAASGAQYMKIMDMSSKLQAQSAADLKKWKLEREAWQIEREALLSRLAGRPNGKEGLSNAAEFVATAVSAALPQAIIAAEDPKSITKSENSMDFGCVKTLRNEIVQLRKRCHEAQASLEAWRADSVDLKDISVKLAELGERMQARGVEFTSNMGITGSSHTLNMGITRSHPDSGLSS